MIRSLSKGEAGRGSWTDLEMLRLSYEYFTARSKDKVFSVSGQLQGLVGHEYQRMSTTPTTESKLMRMKRAAGEV